MQKEYLFILRGSYDSHPIVEVVYASGLEPAKEALFYRLDKKHGDRDDAGSGLVALNKNRTTNRITAYEVSDLGTFDIIKIIEDYHLRAKEKVPKEEEDRVLEEAERILKSRGLTK